MSATTAYTFARVVLLTCLPAQAGPCMAREVAAVNLSEQYAETLSAAGLQSATGLVELWTSPDGATWTLLMTRPDGITCVIAAGTNWSPALPVPAGVLN